MLRSRANSQAPLRGRSKTRRFNSSIFNRPTVSEQPCDTFSLCEQKQQYKERRSQAEALHERNSKAGLANAVLSLLCVFCAFFDNEMSFYGKITDLQSASVRCLIICFSVMQGALTVQNAKNWLSLLKILGFKHQCTSLTYEKQRLTLLTLELLHLCVVLPPGVNAETKVSTRTHTSPLNLADIITVMITLRLYHVVKFVYSQSPYLMPRAQFYTALHGVYNRPFFIVMGQMATHPFETLYTVGFTVLLLAGFLLHITERTAESSLLLYDGPWIIAITQLTVGYGETPPRTDLGRIVAIGPGILGVCTLSLVVSCAFGKLQLSRTEKKMVEELFNTRQKRTKLLPIVAVFLQRMWRLRLARRLGKPRLKELFLYRVMYRIFRVKFSAILAGSNPEIEQQIKIFRSKTKKVFKTANKRLRPMWRFNNVAGSLATHNFHVVSALLGVKRAYLRLTKLFPQKPRSITFMPLRRLRGINKTIIYKMDQEVAFRRMKERVASRKEKHSTVVVVDEESVSVNDSEPDLGMKPTRTFQ